jgi:hypothetical protein
LAIRGFPVVAAGIAPAARGDAVAETERPVDPAAIATSTAAILTIRMASSSQTRGTFTSDGPSTKFV